MLSNKKIAIIASSVLVAGALGGVGIAMLNSNSSYIEDIPKTTDSVTIETANTTEYVFETEPELANTIAYKGKNYKLRDDITTILFMGIDGDVDVKVNDITGGGGRADTVMLFVLDETNNVLNVLEISRDTMVDVDVYNTERDLLYTGNMQICMQYSFSDSSKRGCMLMKNKVSNLLFGASIDNYCSLTVNGMVAIVEEMGGITLTFEDDYSFIDERYTVGSTVTLNGQDVNRFVRYRDTDETGSNNDRMDRQSWFLNELFRQMTGKGGSNLVSLYEAAGDHLCTDMDVDKIKSLSSVSLGDIAKAPGEVKAGEYHDEYYVDDEALKEVMIRLLYEEV